MFFFRVRDTGSWLQIGESITFFFMSSLLFLFSAGMSALGEWLMKDTIETRFELCIAKRQGKLLGREGTENGNDMFGVDSDKPHKSR
jgi:hypothetical protein